MKQLVAVALIGSDFNMMAFYDSVLLAPEMVSQICSIIIF